MDEIRQARPEDLDAFYHISLVTGHLGADASHLYTDPDMMGHIYSAPYLKSAPELAIVVERQNNVVGFCVGTSDTRGFDATLEANWWPTLRAKYPEPNEKTRSSWTADERRCQMIHTPSITPEKIITQFPAHLHMNLLPVVQGEGVGAVLLRRWLQRAAHLDVREIHIGANRGNDRAVTFWHRQGFRKLPSPHSTTIFMGRQLGT